VVQALAGLALLALLCCVPVLMWLSPEILWPN
jgi:hypothetical protein